MSQSECDAKQFLRPVSSSATRRYMRHGRDAVRRDHSRTVGALFGSSATWSKKITSTSWVGVLSTGEGRSGLRQDQTVAELVAEREEYAQSVNEKGEGLISTLATTHGGSTDAECTSRSGLYLDSDFSGDWSRVLSMLDEARITYVAQRRLERKFHILIPYAVALVPAKDVKRWKEEYVRRLGWVLGVMSEIAWPGDDTIYFDPATTRLCTLEYVYCRRDDDESPPDIRHADRLALDWNTFLRASGFNEHRDAEAAMAKVPIRTAYQVAAEAPRPSTEMWQTDPIRARLYEIREWKARMRHRSPEAEAHYLLLDRVLRGVAFASPHGRPVDGVDMPGRHDAVVQLAGMLAATLHKQTPESAIAHVLFRSFDSVDWSDESTGRDADDVSHGAAVFFAKLREFRERLPEDRQLTDYRSANALHETISKERV